VSTVVFAASVGFVESQLPSLLGFVCFGDIVGSLVIVGVSSVRCWFSGGGEPWTSSFMAVEDAGYVLCMRVIF
jgi:hypothetical protein